MGFSRGLLRIFFHKRDFIRFCSGYFLTKGSSVQTNDVNNMIMVTGFDKMMSMIMIMITGFDKMMLINMIMVTGFDKII